MDEIIVKGKLLPVVFGIRVIQQLADKHDMTLGKTMSVDMSQSLDIVADASALALNEGARRAGVDTRYTSDDVIDMIDDRLELFGELALKLSHAVQICSESVKAMGKQVGQTSPKNPTLSQPK